MRKLKVALGKSRFEKKWKNTEASWSHLLKKFSETVYTYETQKEYLRMSKTKQDDIKDIGGFVGGHLIEGQRRNGNVELRSMLTLDADFANIDFWDDFSMLYGFAAAVYSTHKHSPGAPRLRLLIPLDRDVSPEEYEAIARKVADWIDIELFDDTTYQATRLMYWPSTSKGSTFEFQHQEGEFLSADEVLAEYSDWTDVSYWPQSSRVDAIKERSAKQQGDPLEKTGPIGAFCKTHSISEVIDMYLSDVYEPTAVDGRYSYVHGSTASGLVVYDDKFAYSNHATDPISGLLCNAFDLVRIHLYGDLDSSSSEDVSPVKLPSYLRMLSLVDEDASVKSVLLQERMASAEDDFKEFYDDLDSDASLEKEAEEIDYDDLSWQESLEFNKGKIVNSINNAYLIIKYDGALRHCGRYNEFNTRTEVTGSLPWDVHRIKNTVWNDNDDKGLRLYFERVYGFRGAMSIADAIALVQKERSYHPIRDILDPLVWDKTPRLDTLLVDTLNAEDSEYTRAVTRKALTAAVARIYKPGIKYDYMVTLSGPQGLGKSTLISKLAKNSEYFTDGLTSVGTKDAYDELQGKWFVEMAELTATRKADVEAVKQFISKQDDSYRQAYQRHSAVFKRQCTFWATTNDDMFLRDATGNRRFWPLACSVGALLPPWDLTEEYIDQVLAEAKYRFEKGETLFLSPELEAIARDIQKGHMIEDTWEGMIEDFLDKLLPKDWELMSAIDRQIYFAEDFEAEGYWKRGRICSREIWDQCLGNGRKEMTNADSYRINTIMKNMPGWESSGSISFKGYGRQRGYSRIKSRKFEYSKDKGSVLETP